jgi:DNA-binding PadR family transcriptional regulator
VKIYRFNNQGDHYEMRIQRSQNESRDSSLFIGNFQFEVLRKVKHLGSKAYGINIRRSLEQDFGKEVHTPQVYTALVRLEKLGLITSEIDRTASAGRRGRPRRVYHLMAPGQRMLMAGSVLSEPVSAKEKIPHADGQRPTTA